TPTPLPNATYIDRPESDHGGKKVKYLGDLEQAMEGMPAGPGPAADSYSAVPDPVRQTQHPTIAGHEAWYSTGWLKGDKTLFIGAQQADFEQYFIVDIDSWLNRPDGVTPSGPPKTVSETSGRGHSTRTATINGVPYLL